MKKVLLIALFIAIGCNETETVCNKKITIYKYYAKLTK